MEKYYSISPYAYVGNNPILYVDPNGEDYWSTNDPETIARFFASLNRDNAIATIESFDYSDWNHIEDKEVFKSIEENMGLTYNDETNTSFLTH